MSLTSNSTVKDLAVIFENCIIPLLQEYFYDDYEKIRLVLGDNNKQDDKLVFVKTAATDNVGLFGNVSFDFDETFTYEINEKAFEEIDSYKEDINVPMRPIKIEKDENDCIILTCAKCNQKFQKSSRCSFCGQKVLITEDDIQNIKNKRKLIDLDDWIHESDFGEISPSEMQRCISLILESGFIYHVGTSDLSLDYKFKEDVTLRNMVMFWGEGSRMAIQPSILFDFVSELSFGKEDIEDYLINLTRYLSPKQKNKPYDNIKGYYFIDYSTFIEKCDEIIDLHKELVDKIFQKM